MGRKVLVELDYSLSFGFHFRFFLSAFSAAEFLVQHIEKLSVLKLDKSDSFLAYRKTDCLVYRESYAVLPVDRKVSAAVSAGYLGRFVRRKNE